MAGEYTWDQMPEELALQLYAFAEEDMSAGDLQEWLQNEMQHCAATKLQWPRLSEFCPDLPVPGSEFCNAHMPKEDRDDG